MFDQRHCFADLGCERVVGRPKVGEGQESHARFEFELSGKLGGAAGDLGQVFRRGLDIDRGIREEEDPVLDDHDVDTRHQAGARPGAVDLQGGFNDFRVLVGEAGHIGVRVAHLDHHGAEHVRLAHALVGFWQDHALAGAQFMEGFDIFFEAFEVVGIDNGAIQVECHFRDLLADHFRAADQDRDADAFILHLGSRTDDLGLFAFAKSNALLGFGGLGLVHDEVAHTCALALAEGQLFAILVNVDLLAGHAGFHGRFGYRCGFP